MASDANDASPLARPALRELTSETAWTRFWYGEGSLVRLGVYRWIMMAGAVYGLLNFRVVLRQEATQAAVGYLNRKWTPIYALDVLGVPPMGETAFHVAQAALWIAIALTAVGFLTRLSSAVTALLLFYWIGSAYSFGKPHHEYTVLMFGVAALPFGPAGARLSVDAWLGRLRAKRRAAAAHEPLPPLPEAAPFARLPIRVAQFTAALAYGFAGLSKLAIAGPTWANGYTLQGIMLGFQAPWTEVMTQSLVMAQLSSIFVLTVQSTFPLVLVFPRLRWFYLPAAISFHMMSWQTMDTGPYMGLWITLCAFVRWDRVPSFLGPRLGSGPPWRRAGWGLFVLVAAGGPAWLFWRQLTTLSH